MTRTRPATVHILPGLPLFQGLSGIAGGIGLAAEPTGRSTGLDPGWLAGSPFPDCLVPGLVLLPVLGFGPLAAASGMRTRASWAWPGSVGVGVASGPTSDPADPCGACGPP